MQRFAALSARAAATTATAWLAAARCDDEKRVFTIFLDVDGVLNSRATRDRGDAHRARGEAERARAAKSGNCERPCARQWAGRLCGRPAKGCCSRPRPLATPSEAVWRQRASHSRA